MADYCVEHETVSGDTVTVFTDVVPANGVSFRKLPETMTATGYWRYDDSSTNIVPNFEERTYSPKLEFSGCLDENLLSEYFRGLIEKGEDDMTQKTLLKLVYTLNLSKSDMEEIEEVLSNTGWMDALLLYILAKSVKEGLKLEDLGMKRRESK